MNEQVRWFDSAEDSVASIDRRGFVRLGAGVLACSLLTGPMDAYALLEPDIDVTLEALGQEIVELKDGSRGLRIHLEATNSSREDYGSLTFEVKFGDADGYLVGTEVATVLGLLRSGKTMRYEADVSLPASATNYILRPPSSVEIVSYYVGFYDPPLTIAVLGPVQQSMDVLVQNRSVADEYPQLTLKVKLVDDDGFTVDMCETQVEWGALGPALPEKCARAHVDLSLTGMGNVVFDGIESYEAVYSDHAKIIEFGSYPTWSGGDPEPIAWCILERKDGRALIITERAIDGRLYNDKHEETTWEACTLRSWLNGSFLREAFSPGELTRIAETRVLNPDNPEFGTDGGSDTDDKVFLLSIDEVYRYFPAEEDRICRPTQLARDSRVYRYSGTGGCCWWLRSPGYDARYAAYVNTFGNAFMWGSYVDCPDNSYNAVRPALWLNLES